MSLEKRVKEFAERARQILLAQAATDRENKEGKGTWQGYGTDGRGRVKKDGETKPVNMIGEISLPTDADVFLDSTDSIEFQKATPKTNPTKTSPKTSPNIPESKVTTKIEAPVTKNRSVVLDDSYITPEEQELPPYFLFITFSYNPQVRNVFDSSASAFRRSYIDQPALNVFFRVEQSMLDDDKGIVGTFKDSSVFGLDFRPRDVSGNLTGVWSNPSSWLGFPVFDPQPDSLHCDRVWYSSRYTDPWVAAGRQDLVNKALLALRHVTEQQLSLQLGGVQNDAAYLQNSCDELLSTEWVPSFGGPGEPSELGASSGFAVADGRQNRWSPNPTIVSCPEIYIINPGYDAATCYFWGDTVQNATNPPAGVLQFNMMTHVLYLADLDDENTWRWAFGSNILNPVTIQSGFPSIVGTCFQALGSNLAGANNGSMIGWKGSTTPVDQVEIATCENLHVIDTENFITFNFQ